jgi:hypothetical protein
VNPGSGAGPGAGLRVYSNTQLGVRFEIDDSFVPGPSLELPAGTSGDVRSAYLATRDPAGAQAVLSITRVEVGYDTSPQELAEHLLIHNRYAAHTAEQNGWTIHAPWRVSLLGGHPAMHCDYVVPDRDGAVAAGAAASAPGEADGPPPTPDSPLAAPTEDSTAGHVQAWVAYAGHQTLQLMLSVDPPGDLVRNRATLETVVRTFEISVPPADDSGGETVRPAGG